MTEVFIFDAIRTPRGRGKSSGALHEVKPVKLLSGLMKHMAHKHQLDTALVDDVVIGCVSPVGEQGSVIARTAALSAGWDLKAAGIQVNRFCASGLEAVNLAAQKVASGWEDFVVAGGVESMSRVPMGSDGGAWAQDPETNLQTGFVPQGIAADLIATLDGYEREDV
ncbi:MAG: beta-ketoacyl synthase N-terminal-like domain-containing protein, partial [Burkholderiaceae bacterium]